MRAPDSYTRIALPGSSAVERAAVKNGSTSRKLEDENLGELRETYGARALWQSAAKPGRALRWPGRFRD
jgi:hypothetical protein